MKDASNEGTGTRITRNNRGDAGCQETRRDATLIEPQVGLSLAGVGAMARITVLGKQRTYTASVVNRQGLLGEADSRVRQKHADERQELQRSQ